MSPRRLFDPRSSILIFLLAVVPLLLASPAYSSPAKVIDEDPDPDLASQTTTAVHTASTGMYGDFNGDGNPDYTLYETDTRQTAIWYLSNNVYTGSAWGPTLPAGWSLTAP